jgi:hypothetical protein
MILCFILQAAVISDEAAAGAAVEEAEEVRLEELDEVVEAVEEEAA